MVSLILAIAFGSKLDAVLDDPKLEGAVVSAVVTDLDGNVLFERNSAMHVTPASNMKLLSNAFGLYQLGPDWRPATRIWKEQDRTVIESTGDPMLTHDQLVAARERLRLDRRLPVYVRQEYAPRWGTNWEYGDLPNKYSAPVTAFTVDRGSFEIWAEKGRPRFKPEAYGTKVVKVSSLPPGTALRYDPFRRTLFAAPGAFTKDGRLDTLSLPDPDEAAASLLGRELRLTDVVPTRAPDLEIAGPSTLDIVGACLPPSDNQLAEHLLLLGARREGPLGLDPYATAQTRLKNFLTRIVGVVPGDLKIDDGSGLSRHNFVTTRGIAKLLAWSAQQPTAEAWRAAMAHGGKGTLANRLKTVKFDGKTGSLDMVVALSGFVETDDRQTRVVSVILNGFGCPSGEARGVADRFVETVARGL